MHFVQKHGGVWCSRSKTGRNVSTNRLLVPLNTTVIHDSSLTRRCVGGFSSLQLRCLQQSAVTG